MLESLLTVGFFVWGAGEGGALLLWLPLLLFKMSRAKRRYKKKGGAESHRLEESREGRP